MRIKPYFFVLFVPLIFLGAILMFQAAGFWSVSGKMTSSGEAVQPSAADVNTIKGWMTLEQISTTYGVPVTDILKQFDLPADTPASTALKDLETDVFSVTNLRIWLQEQILPGKPEDIIPPTQEVKPTPTLSFSTQAATVHAAPEKTVTGKTTFQELLDWGVTEEAIREIIGGDLPSPSTVIKDYMVAQGLEFSTIKAAIQAAVNNP